MHFKKRLTIENYSHPVIFFSLALGITAIFWFAAAYISFFEPSNKTYSLIESSLIFLGALVPVSIAMIMIWSNPLLKTDFLHRIFKKTKPFYFVAACLIMIVSLLLAETISLLFGYSTAQFALAQKTTFSAGYMSGWVLLILAPFVEEFAWHSYGTDSLRNKFNLLTTCIIFIILWELWHAPLFFVKNYYHYNLLRGDLIYLINYLVSFFPFVVITNWLYYKSGRCILLAVLMHFTADISAELFATAPMSKVIQTIILTVVAIIIIITNRSFFFNLEYKE